jgi:hypothetical protein
MLAKNNSKKPIRKPMKRIPKGGIPIEIHGIKWLLFKAHDTPRNTFGECVHLSRCLLISSELFSPHRIDDSLIISTVFHEIGHAIIGSCGCLDNADDETTVELYGIALAKLVPVWPDILSKLMKAQSISYESMADKLESDEED